MTSLGKIALLLLAAWAGAADIRLRPAAEVDGPGVLLREIADLPADADPRLHGIVVDRAESVARTLPAQVVRAAIARALPGSAVAVTGSTRVSRRMRSIDDAELLAAVRRSWAVETPDGIELMRVTGSVSVPAAAEVAVEATALDARAGSGEIAHKVVVRCEGVEAGRVLLVARIQRTVATAVAARDLARGEVIAAADLREERRAARSRDDGLAIADLVGRMAAQPIAAGSVIASGATVTAPLVRGGHEVRLIIGSGRFTLSTAATSLADGGMGARIAVRRATDGATVQAIVTGSGELALAAP